MNLVADKLLVLAQKCDDAGLVVEARVLDRMLEKLAFDVIAAGAVTVTVKEDQQNNQWVGTTSENPPRLTVSNPIFNPASDRSPENHQRGILAMRAELRKQLGQSYPAGTHFVFQPPQFG